ncbi:MAG: sensor histidine kinase [Desulfobulbaceae bacterium]|nr:MAG: sensor histidine kinase [Desulfobulbaceae bacterium]
MQPETQTYKDVYDYVDTVAPLFFFMLSPDGKILRTNQFTRAFLDRKLEGIAFKEVIVDFSGEFDLATALKSNDEQRLTLSRGAGLPQSLYFTLREIGDHILAYGRLDMAEIERMQHEVLALNTELNNLTRELSKKTIQLTRLNEEKNRFLGMAAHDLRKPISVVLTYSEFILDEVDEMFDEEHRGFLQTINRSATSMKHMVDDFLDVSAIEAGQFQLNKRATCPIHTLKNSLTMARIQAEKKQVIISVKHDETIEPLDMDGDKIEQALSNLLGNAVEHSESGSVVSVSLVQDQANLIYIIADSGAGIDEQTLKDLFVPFKRGGSQKTAGEASTGLGLAITHKIIAAHKGKLLVESTPGQGTIFTIILNREEINE